MKAIKKLAMHESLLVSTRTECIRVPGGLLYLTNSVNGVHSVFVPFTRFDNYETE